MTGSTHSLDETNTESATTIKRQTTATYEPLGKGQGEHCSCVSHINIEVLCGNHWERLVEKLIVYLKNMVHISLLDF